MKYEMPPAQEYPPHDFVERIDIENRHDPECRNPLCYGCWQEDRCDLCEEVHEDYYETQLWGE